MSNVSTTGVKMAGSTQFFGDETGVFAVEGGSIVTGRLARSGDYEASAPFPRVSIINPVWTVGLAGFPCPLARRNVRMYLRPWRRIGWMKLFAVAIGRHRNRRFGAVAMFW